MMKKILGLSFAVALALPALLAAAPAEAHLLGAHGAGFTAGFAHPLFGLDHLIAMFAVGLWAAQLGGRAQWLVPAGFVAAMTIGGALGILGVGGSEIPYLETGIAASVLLLGVLVASRTVLPVAAGMAVVAVFALLHGHAHGTEIPGAASPVGYAAGFVLATSLVHVAGVFTGRAIGGFAKGALLRAAGGAVAASGVVLLAAL
jgi:urease accessory protein